MSDSELAILTRSNEALEAENASLRRVIKKQNLLTLELRESLQQMTFQNEYHKRLFAIVSKAKRELHQAVNKLK